MRIVENRFKYFLISGVAMLVGIAFLIGNAAMGNGIFNYDVEFTGGTEMTIDIGQDFSNDDIAAIITESTDVTGSQIQRVLSTNQVSIKMKSLTSEQRTALMTAIQEKYGIDDSVFSVNDISGSISKEMQTTAIQAVLVACLGILLYVSLRFRDVRMGASAILALVHDSIFVILSYAVFRIPLNYSFIAAVLTILGFSINATIIVFDRIRENRRLMRRPGTEELINTSINQTLKRCIYTSLTVLIVTVCLFVMGVSSIRDFMLPIMVGVIWGTYSSIFLSGSLYYTFLSGRRKARA